MNDLTAFINARLAEEDFQPEIVTTYKRIMAVAYDLRSAGIRSDERSWLTGAIPLVKIGEYILGADPAAEADDFSDQILICLAATWSNHPDFDAAWSARLPDAPRSTPPRSDRS